jgi:hypothetical protein
VGLWYSVGNSWFRFLLSDYPGFIKTHIYRLEIDTTNLYKIQTEKELDEFTQVYGRAMFSFMAEDGLQRKDDGIDWELVARGYTGIEIAPYIYSRRCSCKWYYGWDCASGVIWNSAAVKKLELLTVLE